MKVYNLTKHALTEGQIKDGGINVEAAQKSTDSLFDSLPSASDMKARADRLVALAVEAGAVKGDGVLIAGAMYFVPVMIQAAKDAGLVPTFSFTQRVASEVPDGEGGVKLSYTFKHEGWMVA